MELRSNFVVLTFLSRSQKSEFPVASIKVIGESTNQNGPYFEDWFLCLGDESGWLEVPVESEGFPVLFEELGMLFGFAPRLRLNDSTDFKSRVIWPQSLAAYPLFEYTRKWYRFKTMQIYSMRVREFLNLTMTERRDLELLLSFSTEFEQSWVESLLAFLDSKEFTPFRSWKSTESEILAYDPYVPVHQDLGNIENCGFCVRGNGEYASLSNVGFALDLESSVLSISVASRDIYGGEGAKFWRALFRLFREVSEFLVPNFGIVGPELIPSEKISVATASRNGFSPFSKELLNEDSMQRIIGVYFGP